MQICYNVPRNASQQRFLVMVLRRRDRGRRRYAVGFVLSGRKSRLRGAVRADGGCVRARGLVRVVPSALLRAVSGVDRFAGMVDRLFRAHLLSGCKRDFPGTGGSSVLACDAQDFR